MERNQNMCQDYGVTHTLEETAYLMGITRERVRQIEKQALQKLKKVLTTKYGIKSFSQLMWS